MDWGGQNHVNKVIQLFLLTEKGAKNFPKPDLIMYNSIIDTYSKNRKQEGAFNCLSPNTQKGNQT
jgi:hypothetical protein